MLIHQRCIKSCINDKFGHAETPCAPRGFVFRKFRKLNVMLTRFVYPPKKPCRESLSRTHLVEPIENALADAINAEVDLIKNGNFTAEQKLLLTNKLEDLLKLAIKKEIVLEFLIEDATNACKIPRKKKDCDEHFE